MISISRSIMFYHERFTEKFRIFWFQYKRARVYNKRMKLFKEENRKFDHFYKQFKECVKNSDRSREYDECCKAYYTLAMVASRKITAHFEFLKFHGGW